MSAQSLRLNVTASNLANANSVIGGGPRNNGWFDVELLAQDTYTAPRSYRIVRAKNNAGERIANRFIRQDCLHSVSAKETVTKLDNDYIGFAGGQ